MLRANRDIKSKRLITSAIIMVIILDLISLYFFKYKNQHLSISNFDLSNKGNLFNLIFSLILIVEIFLYLHYKKTKYQTGILLGFTLSMTLILILAQLFVVIKIPLPNYYILDHSLRDFIKVILFSSFQFVQFLFISYLGLSLLRTKELLFTRSIVNSIAISILLLIYAFINLYGSKVADLNEIKNKKNNYVGVVLGAAVWPKNMPSPSLASRTDKAYELLKKGIIKKIQLTGGHAPGEMSESEVAYKYLINKGIKPDDIWIEKRTASTNEQIRFIKSNLVENKNIRNIIVISDSYHLKRIQEICNFFNIQIKVVASDLSVGSENRIYHKTKESIALAVFWFFAL